MSSPTSPEPAAAPASAAPDAAPTAPAPDAAAASPAPSGRFAADGWVDAAVLLGFLALALWVLQPLWRAPAHLFPADNTADPGFFEWTLIHAARIFTHGENPFLTPSLNAPYGVNLMANTGLLGLTVPLVPVTLLFGPSASLALMLTIGPAATAGAWYWVLRRHWGYRWGAAALGGAFAGFAPAMINHTNAHPNLIAQFVLPFLVSRALRMRTRRDGLVVGLLATWQAFLNEELLFLAALATALVVAGYAAFRPGEVRERVRPFLRGLVVAAGTAAVLLAYPVWFQFLGPQSYRGLPAGVLGYGADLASYAAFPKLSVSHGTGTLSPIPEENTFFGWPLLLVVAGIVCWLWRRVVIVRALALTSLVIAVMSLGADGEYHGRVFWHSAPWHLLNGLPLFDSVLPVRLGLVVTPMVAVLLARGAHEVPTARGPGYLWLPAMAAALVPLLPVQLPVTPRPGIPVFFTSGRWRAYVSGDQALLSADPSVWYGGIIAMRWDNATDHGYRMVGGYFLGPDESGKGIYGAIGVPTAGLLGSVVYEGKVPAIGPEQRSQLVTDVHRWHLAAIVLADDAPHADELRTTLNDLVGAGQRVADVWLWDVRGR